MPRERKQVARFDPSPKAVAPWKNTAGKVIVSSRTSRKSTHLVPTLGVKRQRSSYSPKSAIDGSSRPSISDLRGGLTAVNTLSPPVPASAASKTPSSDNVMSQESSLSGGTSDSDSEYSFSSDSSHQKLPWRGAIHAPAAVSEESTSAAGENSGIEGCTSVIDGSTSDTDSSEYCGDASVPSSSSSSTETTSSDVSLECTIGGKDNGLFPEGDGEVVPEQQPNKPRNIVNVRIAKSQMPSRWAVTPPLFKTCLTDIRPEDKLEERLGDAGGVLALSGEDSVDSKNWLCSEVIEVIMAKLARTYPSVHFMPIDFSVMCLNGWGSSTSVPATAHMGGDGSCPRGMVFRDILGRPIIYSEKRSVVFFTHVNNIHWNLLRVEHEPVPELQLFEPMGRPPRRTSRTRANTGGRCSSAARGNSFRCIPKGVYRWLDSMWPMDSDAGGPSVGTKRKAPSDGWASRTYSAITRQQQTTGFDCGVASLLYAEKCGQGEMREDIDAWTSQKDMTKYRQALQRYFKSFLANGGASA